MKRLIGIGFAAFAFAAASLADAAQSTIKISSPAFENGGAIPSRYTCDGAGVSPPLSWTNVPADAKSVALVVDDPDAPHGTFVHWVLFDIAAGTTALPEDAMLTLPLGSLQGKNGKNQVGWTGPCPPSGNHHYHFKLYALRDTVTLAQPSETELMRAIQGNVLAQGELVGTYQRTKK